MSDAPRSLADGGRNLWDLITDEHELDVTQLVQLEEACRAKDRLDKLDEVLRGQVECWSEIVSDHDGTPISLRIDSALDKANTTANLMKQLLAALRLPDAQTGKKPQYRGARGAQKPTVAGGKVSSLDRHRNRTSSA